MIIGTAGHIDHGKTALVKRLTGVDADRLKEEKARGITIALGYAYWPRPDGTVTGFVDVPGHERLVHNMLAGATGIDAVMLVIAADDGVMPQTREHLAIIDLLGLDRGVVALNKADLATPARLAEATSEIAAALAGTGLAGVPILPVSASTGEGIAALTTALDGLAAGRSRRPSDGRFRLAIDRSFTLKGLGTVVTGTVLSGAVMLDDTVTISPAGLTARVRSVHAQNQPAERGIAGQRCALALSGPGISTETVRRGAVVLDPVLHAPTGRLDVRLSVLPTEARPLGQWMPVRVHHGAADVGGRIVVLRDAALAPGETDYVQFVLEEPIAVAAGDRIVLRDTSAQRTIAGGVILDLRAPERRRRTTARRAELAALDSDDAPAALAALLDLPRGVVDLDAFVRDRALGAGASDRLIAALELVRLTAKSSLVMRRDVWSRFAAEIGERLDACHRDNPEATGLSLETLRRAVSPLLSPAVFPAAVERLIATGVAALDRSWLRRPGHVLRLSDDDEATWSEILPHLSGRERFRPPRVRDIARSLELEEAYVRKLARMAARRGDVEEIAHDHFFSSRVVAEMADVARTLAAEAPRGFTVIAFRDRLDNGRKVAIQILEFFDRQGLTMRRGDHRRINPHRAALFAAPAGQPVAEERDGGVPLPVGRPDFKSGWGRQTVPGGFDSHPPPPSDMKAGQ